MPAALGCGCLALAASLAGCHHADLAQQHAQARTESLEQTLKVCAKSAESRPEKVDSTLEHAGWYFENQALELDRNLDGAAWYIERDLKQAAPRLERAGNKTLDMLYGAPEMIEPTAIVLFF